MKNKQFLTLEVLLIIFLTIHLASSFVNYLEHNPQWFMLTAAGFIAVFIFFRPKTFALIFFTLISSAALVITASIGLEVVVLYIHLFVETLSQELHEWQGIYHLPGPLVTLVISLFFVLGLVYIQLFLLHRGRKNFFIVPLGLIIYLWLWSQHYLQAERDLVIFLALALPTLALTYFFSQNSRPKFGYQLSILSLGIICSLVVFSIPNTAFLNTEKVQEIAQSFVLPFKQLQEWGQTGIALFGDRSVVTWGQTGYNPGGELGGPIVESHLPVMELELRKGDFPAALYLRGYVSDHYTGRSWKNIKAEKVETLAPAFEDVQIYEEEIEIYISYLHPENHLFGLFPTTNLLLPGGSDSSIDSFHLDSFGNMKSASGEFEGSYYLSGNVITDINLDEIEPREKLTKDTGQLSPFLQLPEDLPQRLKELSVQVTSEAETDIEKVKKVEDFLRQFPYNTLSPSPPSGEDFVDHFLFEIQEGYCVYFASAMAVLLRAQDIPTRYVEGYRVPVIEDEQTEEEEMEEEEHESSAGNDEETSQKVQVQQNHAHAWVEVFLQGYGWVAFEPTPPYLIYGTNDIETEESIEEEPPVDETEEEEMEETTEEEEIEEGALANNNDTSPHNFQWINWAALFAGILILSLGSKIYYNYSNVKTPADLYDKILGLKSVFHTPPTAGETPGQIVEQLKAEFPQLASNFELMKNYYQLSFYSRENGKMLLQEKELNTLALTTARLYIKKLGILKFAWGLSILFFKTLRERIFYFLFSSKR